MDLIYKQGDLLSCKESVIIHGCNAQGRMNSGVAKQLRDRDENIFTAYAMLVAANDVPTLMGAAVRVTSAAMRKVVINVIIQEDDGTSGGTAVRPKMQYVNYKALRDAMQLVDVYAAMMTDAAIPRFALPRIGAGLAGGNWDIISQIIAKEAVHWQPVVYVYPQTREVRAERCK